MAATASTRKIMILLRDGRKRIVSGIPSNAKITYGPISPGRVGDTNYALRIYTSQQNQLAVFTEVQEFQDLALDIEDECVTSKVEQQNNKKTGSLGNPFAHCSLAPLATGDPF